MSGRVVIATSNAGKVREFAEAFAQGASGWEAVAASELGPLLGVLEDGETFAENAAKKALSYAKHHACPALADDSGLEVAALDGRPGVYSARYAGPGASDEANIDKLLKALGDSEARAAAFVCVLAWASPEGTIETFSGRCPGHILKAPRGSGGFGYDPVFVPAGGERTFAEMTPAEKRKLSHRGKALAGLLSWLEPLA